MTIKKDELIEIYYHVHESFHMATYFAGKMKDAEDYRTMDSCENDMKYYRARATMGLEIIDMLGLSEEYDKYILDNMPDDELENVYHITDKEKLK